MGWVGGVDSHGRCLLTPQCATAMTLNRSGSPWCASVTPPSRATRLSPIAKSYINCTDDTAMPYGEFAWHPRFSARLGLARIVQMPDGHEALFSNPSLLAAKVIEAGRD